MQTSNFEGEGAANCAKTAEPIEMPFGTWTRVGAGKHILDAGAHWRHPVNTNEQSMCCGDADFLSNYYDHMFLKLSFPSFEVLFTHSIFIAAPSHRALPM